MEISIYYYALCVSLTLMLFFSYRFIFGKLHKALVRHQNRPNLSTPFSYTKHQPLIRTPSRGIVWIADKHQLMVFCNKLQNILP